jgi:hypothetical protein
MRGGTRSSRDVWPDPKRKQRVDDPGWRTALASVRCLGGAGHEIACTNVFFSGRRGGGGGAVPKTRI